MNSILESKWSFLLTNEMVSRVKVGIVMIVLIYLCLTIDIYYFEKGLFTVAGLFAVFAFAGAEVNTVMNKLENSPGLFTVLLLLLFIPSFSFLALWHYHNDILPIIIAVLIATVFSTDTTALLVGKIFGKDSMRLAPKISPNKSMIGAVGGCAIGTVIFISLSMGYLDFSFSKALICGVYITVSSVVGDLIQSYAKRRIGVKDSGTILRGHGGAWDRFDSFALPPVGLVIAFLL